MNKPYGIWLSCLAALAMSACGGDGGGEDSTDPAAMLAPGSTYQQEIRLASGETIVAQYMVHGVTLQGELVDAAQPDLVRNRLVPLLVSETLDGRSAPQASPPQLLVQEQRSFFKRTWDAYAALKQSSNPDYIAGEIADLDARIVDLMDDSAASSLSLSEYLSLFEPLDKAPEFKDLAYAELILHDALIDGVKGSTLQAASANCPVGAERVPSQSGISWYCQPAKVDTSLAAESELKSISSYDAYSSRMERLRLEEIHVTGAINQLVKIQLAKYQPEIKEFLITLDNITAQLKINEGNRQENIDMSQAWLEKFAEANKEYSICQQKVDKDPYTEEEKEFKRLEKDGFELSKKRQSIEMERYQLHREYQSIDIEVNSLRYLTERAQADVERLSAERKTIQNQMNAVRNRCSQNILRCWLV